MRLSVLVDAVVGVSPDGSVPAWSLSFAADDKLSFVGAVLHAGLVEKAIMLVLAGFSVVSWAIIAHKMRTISRAHRESQAFLDSFWDTKRLDAIMEWPSDQLRSPLAQVFRAGYIELAKLQKKDKDDAQESLLGIMESVERSMRRTAASERTGLESLISFLGTTGSTAPFIGLLGTVIGIMNAFQRIGIDKSAGLETVAPGIGGALVATAFGLFAAIPAVIGFNHFIARIRVIETEMESFSADFLNIIKRHY